MSTESLEKKERKLNPLIPAVLLAIYVIWEIFAMVFDYSDVSGLCPSPLLLISVAVISVLLFMKKRGIILVIPFGLLSVTYIFNIFHTAIDTYYAYFPLNNSVFANAMRFEYFCNIFILVIDFAISANIILLLISNTRSSSNKNNLTKYALLVLVIARILFFLFYHLRATLDTLIYMPIDFVGYFLLTPFLYYIGLLLCGFRIADTENKA